MLLIATPAVMLLINDLDALPRSLKLGTVAAIAVVALTIYDVVGRSGYAVVMQLSIVTLCALVEVSALIVLRFKRAA